MSRVAAVRIKKGLGQHFLTQPEILRRIVDFAAVPSDAHVLEIGPGRGHLTAELLARGLRVTAVELDSECVPILRDRFGKDARFTLNEQDALALDFDALRANDGPAHLVSNLPYLITGPVMERLMGMARPFDSVTLLLQREVVERLCASAGTKEYGALTLCVAMRFEVQRGFVVKPGSFTPPPKVDSATVRLTRRAQPAVQVPLDRMDRVIRAAFAHRRKQVANSLSVALGLDHHTVSASLAAAGLQPSDRAERWGLAEFEIAARALGY